MPLDIAVLGLGYVGTTAALCLAADGHRVLGIDLNPDKVAALEAGRPPVAEPGAAALLGPLRAAGRIRGASGLEPWLEAQDLVLVCVGTPEGAEGRLDLGQLLEATRQLGRALAGRAPGRPPLGLVYRSTVPPGTMEGLVLPTLALASGAGPGAAYEVAYHPEFLREGSAITDYRDPARIVVGERAPGLTRRLWGLHDGLAAPWFEVSFRTAETLKLVDNGFHALKVAFANEVGRLCAGLDVDPRALVEIFLADRKLNLAPAYLRPGGPYGGACLPKDLAALLAAGREQGLKLPVLAAARASNALHLAWLVERIRARQPPPGPLLLLGLAFKPGTDDLRHSPWLELAAALVRAGYELRAVDPDLDPRQLIGANLRVALEHREILLERLTPELDRAAEGATLALLAKPDLARAVPQGLPVLDLTRLDLDRSRTPTSAVPERAGSS